MKKSPLFSTDLVIISSYGSFSSSPGRLPRLWHFRSRCRCCWHASRLWLWWLWHGGGYAARWIGVRVRRSIGILTTWVIASIISTVPALAWIISCWPAGSLCIITSISSFWGLRKHLRPFTTSKKKRIFQKKNRFGEVVYQNHTEQKLESELKIIFQSITQVNLITRCLLSHVDLYLSHVQWTNYIEHTCWKLLACSWPTGWKLRGPNHVFMRITRSDRSSFQHKGITFCFSLFMTP